MLAKSENIDAKQVYDLLVVGGGVNGVGIARDAAGRGLSVLLCEKGDLGGATSSASTKLIHGGLRYLEYYEFRLVREALAEREVQLRMAPHIVRPMRFVLPHDTGQRPAWMIRLGLFLYDHLGGRKLLSASRGVDLRRGVEGAPLSSRLRRGFEYADCCVDDARLVVLNAMDAKARGATVLPHTGFVSARREDGLWRARLREETPEGRSWRVAARALVNAAGPWVSGVLDDIAGHSPIRPMRLVKGSHIVTRRLYEGDHAYILQNDDGRVVFVIPYEQAFSLIGTTEVEVSGDPGDIGIDEAETAYLCEAVNRYFEKPVRPGDVVWSFSGVRPLYDENGAGKSAAAVTRDYVLDLDTGSGGAPLVSVLGGKITTYRRLAEHVLDKLQPFLGFDAPAWTAQAALPGGDIAGADFGAFLDRVRADYPWLPAALAARYAGSYGTRIAVLLDGAGGLADLGEDFGGGLYQAEVEYLCRNEWARTSEDILWRRSKLGLHVPPETTERLAAWLDGSSATAADALAS